MPISLLKYILRALEGGKGRGILEKTASKQKVQNFEYLFWCQKCNFVAFFVTYFSFFLCLKLFLTTNLLNNEYKYDNDVPAMCPKLGHVIFKCLNLRLGLISGHMTGLEKISKQTTKQHAIRESSPNRQLVFLFVTQLGRKIF